MNKTTAEDFLVQKGLMFADTYVCKHCGLQWHGKPTPYASH